MNGIRAKIDYILKHNIFINKIFKTVASFVIRMVGFWIPIDEKSIIFSGHGRKYNDSPRILYEYLIENSQYKDYTFYWALDEPEKVYIPGKCIKIKSDTIKYLVTALKCKYWITCVNIERGLRFKRKETVYLNTWHGIPMKKVGNDTKGRKDYDFSYINYFCISGDYEVNIYKSAFNVRLNQIIKTGLPRNDELFNVSKKDVSLLKQKLGLPSDKKILLYAPTWRDSKDGGKSYSIKPPIDIEYWKECLKSEYILLLRTHPYTNKLLGIVFDEFVRDYTNYSSINDLMIVSDILISDYSATIFDYSILERPIICFGYDYESFSNERGLYIDVDKEIPGGIVKKENEVIKRILECDYEKECMKTKEFKNKYTLYGGNATKECIDKLFGKN